MMAWEGNDYAETLDEAADILLPLTRLAALLRAPLPDSLSHLGKPIADRAIVAATVFLKQQTISLERLDASGPQTYVPTSELRTFLLRCRGELGIGKDDVEALVSHLTTNVYRASMARRWAPLRYGGDPREERSYNLADVSTEEIALRQELILDLARFHDLKAISGVEMVDYKTYRLKMAIENRETDALRGNLSDILREMSLERRFLSVTIERIRHDFDDVNFTNLSEELTRRKIEYAKINKRLRNCRTMLVRLTDPEASAALSDEEWGNVAQADKMLGKCIDSFMSLILMCDEAVDEIRKAAERNSLYDTSELYDFHKEVVEALPEMTLEQIAELPGVLLFPFAFDFGAISLPARDFMLNVSFDRRRRDDGGFIDMGGMEVANESDSIEQRYADAAKAELDALASFIGSSEGSTSLSEFFQENPGKADIYANGGIFNAVVFEGAMGSAPPKEVKSCRIGPQFVFGSKNQADANDIIFND